MAVQIVCHREESPLPYPGELAAACYLAGTGLCKMAATETGL